MGSEWILIFLVFYPIICALISYGIGRKNKKLRDIFADFTVISEFAAVLALCITQSGEAVREIYIPYFAGMGLSFTADGFRLVYAAVISFMWLMTTVFSREYFKHYRNRNRYYTFMLLTLGATLGVFLSSNLYTTFIFFEMMSFTSYVWVAHDEKPSSLRAAQTYLAVAVIGGMVMLMGLFLLYNTIGTLEISELYGLSKACPDKGLIYASAICISIGFAAKAGAFPLHIWLPKAHPVAPAPASALLSGVLTKSGIFGILVISCNLLYADGVWGRAVLYVGIITMLGGALLALFSINLKRTLACSSMSQIGFIIVGIGMQGLLGGENAIAARGTILHMVNHSIIKLVLFMCAGVIYMNIHKLDLNEIRGYGRKKPLLMFIFLMGALSIGGVPLWSGYISKTLLHESIVEYGLVYEEWIFLISGGLTIAYMTKLFVAIFIEKNEDASVQEAYDRKCSYMNMESKLALLGSAVILPVLGLFPGTLTDKIADAGTSIMNAGQLNESVNYFSLVNLKGGLISIGIGAIIYVAAVRTFFMKKQADGQARVYADRWPAWLDLEDGFYRPLISLLCVICGFFARLLDSAVDFIVVLLRKTIYRDSKNPFELPEGTWLTFNLGRIFNFAADKRGKYKPDGETGQKDYIHLFAIRRTATKETGRVITRSLSFGLLMFCAGFIAITLYMLNLFG